MSKRALVLVALVVVGCAGRAKREDRSIAVRAGEAMMATPPLAGPVVVVGGAVAVGYVGVKAVEAVASLPGRVFAMDREAARDHAQAVAMFDKAAALTAADDCSSARTWMAGIAQLDEPYYATVAHDSRVAWCTLSGRGRSEPLTREARDYARAGNCAQTVALAAQVLSEDRNYYRLVFQHQTAIVGCWRTAHTLPAGVTDATTMQFAVQARNAARRLDCKGARANVKRMRDRPYARAFEASLAFAVCRS